MAKSSTKKSESYKFRTILKIVIIVISAILLLGILLVAGYKSFGLGVESHNVKKDGMDGYIKVNKVHYPFVWEYRFYYVSPAGWRYFLFEDTEFMDDDFCNFIEKSQFENPLAGVKYENGTAIIWWERIEEDIVSYRINIDSYGLFPWWLYVIAAIVLVWGSIAIILIVKHKKKKQE